MKVRNVDEAYTKLRPDATNRRGIFERQDIDGYFDMMNYGRVYLAGRLPDGVDFNDYYVSFYNGGMRKEIWLKFVFSSKKNSFSFEDHTKPAGKLREDYEEIKIKARAIILASCVEA